MIEESRVRQILTLALPIIGGMVSQNILNLVDTAMVGTLGAPALTAVGMGGFLNFWAISLILGISAGVQAMAARRMGEGREGEAALSLNGGILIALGAGLPLGVGLSVFTPIFFPYLNDDPEVIAAGVPYLQARLAAAFAVGINFSFRGFWNGIRQSAVYMRTLVFMHALNIILNYTLIFGNFGAPVMGVEGAGLASALSVIGGSLYYTLMGFTRVRHMGFLRAWPDAAGFRTLVRLSIPNSIQQFFFSGGLTAMFWIFGKVGTFEAAAASIMINIMLVAYLPGIGLGLAAATLVGQALGRGEAADARRWGWDVVRIGMLILGGLGLPMILFPDFIVGIFIQSADAATVIDLARTPLRLSGVLMCMESVGLVLMNALLGAGDSRSVMLASVGMQWGLFLPVAFLLGPVLGFGLLTLWSANLAYRMLLAGVFVVLWRRAGWTEIRV
ncbi:MAG: MATE family efflux transporter [Leptospirales bacterium]|jgi:MATE family multidrug resistance protein